MADISSARPEKEVSPSEDMSTSEREAFNQLIRPADSYTSAGVYWADLPLRERVNFVTSVDAAETKKELSWLWDMFKQDPLSPIGYYFKNAVIPGLGLGLEG
jgi:hypothetical protein